VNVNDYHSLKALGMSSLKKVRYFVKVLRKLKVPIEHLDVSMHKVSEEGRQDVIEFASQCKTLKWPDISATCFLPCEVSLLIKTIARCQGNENNISLKMNFIKFGTGISDVLSAFLENESHKWKFLSFDRCGLKIGSLKLLISVAPRLPRLKKLSLLHSFSSKMRDIGNNIVKLLKSSTLGTPILHGVQFSTRKLKREALPVIETLKFNSTLKRLDLTNNAIGAAGVELLSQALSINTTLQWLQCDGTRVTDLGAFTNLIRTFRSRPSSLHFPYPNTDATNILNCTDAASTWLVSHALFEMETELLTTLALHRKGTKYDRLPVGTIELPMPENLQQATNKLEQESAMRYRNMHSFFCQCFRLPLPYQISIQHPVLGEETIPVDDPAMEVYGVREMMMVVKDPRFVDETLGDDSRQDLDLQDETQSAPRPKEGKEHLGQEAASHDEYQERPTLRYQCDAKHQEVEADDRKVSPRRSVDAQWPRDFVSVGRRTRNLQALAPLGADHRAATGIRSDRRSRQPLRVL
jgi:hypothetical protein